MSAFDRVREGGFSALDIALMESLRVIWPASSAAALHLAGLNSWAVGKGHSCFKLELLDDWPDGQDSALHAQLRAGTWPQAGFIGEASSALPIIVESNRSWLRRYWRHEREVETALLQRAQPAPVTSNAVGLARALDEFLPRSEGTQTDWQRVAAAMSLRAPLSVICGGPGTGKTHTALRLLALHLRLSDKPLRMALAAPTGKAAQRLAESVQAGLHALPLSAEERDALPSAAKTLHRLLGFRPQSVSPLRDADYPLDLDVLIVRSEKGTPRASSMRRAVSQGAQFWPVYKVTGKRAATLPSSKGRPAPAAEELPGVPAVVCAGLAAVSGARSENVTFPSGPTMR